MNLIKKFIRDEEGVTAIEYGLIAALIAVVIIGAVTNLGARLKVMFNSVVTALGGTAAT
ncbi:Flp family type IVb pilin [Sphaerotilus uruguayifluvii]|uniref:Pilus assembly protein Flp/PilA n=1 Tax=Sphaerotilus uruguayifluvii TaxID=2735897 RepID=A0ABX2G0P9_9BURK|nr:Flp family type IVb pilin [Leptothrix sp. C29]NRT55860.1 pilus assembly protein Flp/PilA [Leptothrix sp. C29]